MPKLVLTKRVKPSSMLAAAIPVLSVLVGLALSYALLFVLTGLPLQRFAEVFIDAVYSFQSYLDIYLTLLILGVSTAISFRAGFWNVGAEGQYVAGMLGATYVALFSNFVVYESGYPRPVADPAIVKLTAVLFGAVLGSALSSVAALLKVYMGIHEVPTTLILNYLMYFAVDALVAGPWRGKRVYGYFRTDEIPEELKLSVVHWAPSLRWELLLAVAIVIAFTAYLTLWSPLGLWIKIRGVNPAALRFHGVDEKHVMIAAAAISGFLAGAAGALRLLGYMFRLPYEVEQGKTGYFGYTAILVAWLANRDPLAVPLSAAVVSVLQSLGVELQAQRLVPPGISPAAVSLMITGVTLATYVVLKIFDEYRIKVVQQ